MFLLTAGTPVYASSSLDIAPRYAGTVVGMQNSLANIAGVLLPWLIGYVVKRFWLEFRVLAHCARQRSRNGRVFGLRTGGEASRLIDRRTPRVPDYCGLCSPTPGRPI